MHKAGVEIRKWRQDRKMTAQALGDRIGDVPAQTVYGWESRDKIASPAHQRRLIELGICTADDWLRPVEGAPS